MPSLSVISNSTSFLPAESSSSVNVNVPLTPTACSSATFPLIFNVTVDCFSTTPSSVSFPSYTVLYDLLVIVSPADESSYTYSPVCPALGTAHTASDGLLLLSTLPCLCEYAIA